MFIGLRSVVFYISLVLLLESPRSQALDLGMWIPLKSFQEALSKVQIKESQSLNSFSQMIPTGEFLPKIEGFHFGFYSQQLIHNYQGGLHQFSLNNSNLEIRFDRISINQIIQQNISGNSLNVHIEGICQDVKISVDHVDIYGVTSSLNFNNSNQFQLENVNILKNNLAITGDNLTITTSSCLGFGGFQQQIFVTIKKYVSDSMVFYTKVRELLNDQISRKLNQLSNYYSLKSLRFVEPAGFWIVSDYLPSLTSKKQIEFNIKEPYPHTPTIYLNQEDQLLLYSYYYQDFPKQKYNLNNVSSFKKLLRSRFLQFFVWPVLLKFPKSTLFQMVEEKRNSFILENKFVLQSQGRIITTQSNNSEAFLDWKIQSSGIPDLSLKGEKLALSFKDSTLKLMCTLNSDYQKIHPHAKPPSDYIKSLILKTLKDTTFEFEAPRFLIMNHLYKPYQLLNKEGQFIISYW